MDVRTVRSKSLALLIAAAMLLSVPIVSASAAEAAAPASRDVAPAGVAVGK